MTVSVYNGNPLLKSKGISISWDKEKVEEYVKCSKDPIYFIEKYIKIITVDDGEQPMKLFPYQKKIVQSLHKNRKTAAIICRQAGKTTVVAAFVCWYVIFHEAKTVAILANKAITAREILSRVQFAYERLPNWIQQGVVEWNKGSFILENNSRVLAASTSSSAVRGFSCSMLLLDEYAFVPNTVADEFFASVYPTIASGKESKVAIISTPNGMNHFYKIIKEAESGLNGFTVTKAIWSDVPGRNKKWERDMRATLGDAKFEQEMNCEFVGSSNTLLSSASLRSLVIESPVFESLDSSMRIYENPSPDKNYVITVDVSRGVGGDNTVISVFSIKETPYRLVAQFASNLVNFIELPPVITDIAIKYNNAYVLIESNDLGEAVATSMYMDMEYENLLYSSGHEVSFSARENYGLKTTARTKLVGCNTLKSLLESDQLVVGDSDSILELSNFVRSKGSFAADSGGHDDRVMTLVLFSYLTTQKVFSELTDSSAINKILINKEKDLEFLMKPVGYMSDGIQEDFN